MPKNKDNKKKREQKIKSLKVKVQALDKQIKNLQKYYS